MKTKHQRAILPQVKAPVARTNVSFSASSSVVVSLSNASVDPSIAHAYTPNWNPFAGDDSE